MFGLFVMTLWIYHTYFATRNMSTYSNLKMNEIFILFGNPFSRKNCKKNCYETLLRTYHKRISFKDDSEEMVLNSQSEENKKIKNLNKMVNSNSFIQLIQ
ncbi:MAG: hypothetical protein MJ252_13460 [archaeon]|nr:hypothetical protein [archaeon]